MKWRVEIRPGAEQDVAEAASWYERCQPGLGAEFVEEVIRVWDALKENPLLDSRRHREKNVRWRYPDRFPYRIVYEIAAAEMTVIVAAVTHAARHDSEWKRRTGLPNP